MRGVPLTVLHTWEPQVRVPAARPVIDPRSLAQSILNSGIEHARKTAPDLEVRAVLARAPAAARLIEGGGDAELIVLGPRGAGGFAGLVLGSVAAQVAAHASCPVVIVRRGPGPRPEAEGGRGPGPGDRQRAAAEGGGARAAVRGRGAPGPLDGSLAGTAQGSGHPDGARDRPSQGGPDRRGGRGPAARRGLAGAGRLPRAAA